MECVNGCIHFEGGEIKHHKDCPYYPESMSKRLDELEAKAGQNETLVMLREKITRLKDAYEEAQNCPEMLLSSPTSEEPEKLMDNLEKAREELFKEAT